MGSSLNTSRRSVLQGFTLGAGAVATRVLAADAPVATTKAGNVQGYVDNGINVFKGIPYGEDTARRRFMAALPAKPWTGVRDATNWGPQAPKPSAAPRVIGDSKSAT